MEPDRYWLLYFGLLFVFLGSKTGQAFCWWSFNIVRACFYSMLALAASAIAKLLWKVSFFLLQFAKARIEDQANHIAPKPGNGIADAPRKID